jgi:hypothetical protein
MGKIVHIAPTLSRIAAPNARSVVVMIVGNCLSVSEFCRHHGVSD